jgi:hypothetical protein
MADMKFRHAAALALVGWYSDAAAILRDHAEVPAPRIREGPQRVVYLPSCLCEHHWGTTARARKVKEAQRARAGMLLSRV